MAKGYVDLLKDAIEARNWSEVDRVFEGMTGKKISVAESEPEYEEEEEEPVVRTTARPLQKAKDKKVGENSVLAKKTPIKKISKVNMFVDDGEFPEQKLPKSAKKTFKRGQKRDAAETVTVKCSACRKPAFMEAWLLRTSDGDDSLQEYTCGDCLFKRGK